WLKQLQRLFGRGAQVRKPIQKKPAKARLELEGLEDRVTPSTLTYSGGILTYTAGDGINNVFTLKGNSTKLTFVDTAESIDTTSATLSGFNPSASGNTVTIDNSASFTTLQVDLKDGNDTATLGTSSVTDKLANWLQAANVNFTKSGALP